MVTRSAAFCWAVMVLTLSAGCAHGPLPAPPGAELVAPAYRLGPGDKLRIGTFNEPALTGEFEVSSSGAVAFPLVGEVKAGGLTTTELQAVLEAALRNGFLRNPRVTAEVMNYRPFYILGEVNRPGAYPFANGLTILSAVATANGFTYRADQRRVFIQRAGEARERELPLTTATVVGPGDTVRIAERYF